MIEVDALSYSYGDSGVRAVDDVRFRVEPGEIFGFLGPSGAGKSTTQKILVGLLRDFDGHVRLLDRDLHDWHHDLYEHIGISFEFPNHYLKLTARENLQYFASLYAGETDDPLELLRVLELGDDADKRVGEYSKGMRGRLSVARALLHRPRLLFFDEPTAGLDPGTSRIVRELIRRKRDEGATVFLTTHNMVVADELCDRVAFIVEGRIAQIDAPRALKMRYGKRRVRVERRVDGRLATSDFELDGIGDNADFVAALREGEVETIHTQETTLEEIFIQVTGRTLG